MLGTGFWEEFRVAVCLPVCISPPAEARLWVSLCRVGVCGVASGHADGEGGDDLDLGELIAACYTLG